MKHQFRTSLIITTLVVQATGAHAFSLFGPSVEKLDAPQIQERIREQPLVIAPGTGREGLAVQTKGGFIGGIVLGAVVGSALGSSGAPQPGQNMQQFVETQKKTMEIMTQVSMETAQATTNVLNSQIAEGMNNHSFSGPAAAMRLLLAQQLAAQLKILPDMPADKNDNKDARYVLIVNQPIWLLDFRMMSSLYDLKYNLQTKIHDRQQDSYVMSQECSGTFRDAFELEEWEANDKEKVFAALDDIARQCSGYAMAALGLQAQDVEPPTSQQAATP